MSAKVLCRRESEKIVVPCRSMMPMQYAVSGYPYAARRYLNSTALERQSDVFSI